MLPPFNFGQDTRFLNFLFEPLQCAFNTFTRLYLDFCHFGFHPAFK
jgi:hypothetical protein